MKKVLLLICSFAVILSCQKELSGPTDQDKFDEAKLVNKNWYWGGKQTPQFLEINFKSNDTAVMTQCTWVLPPYRYLTQIHPWQPIGKDSISLGGYHFKVFSLTDSVLITSNWVIGGVSDTVRQTFTTF